MTTFEKQSAGTDYEDRNSRREWDSHQQHAGLPTAASLMCMWTVASYDYLLQVLKAQQQFTHSMLAATTPMLHVAQDITSMDAKEDRPAHKQARGTTNTPDRKLP
jgi:hypothetical protein